MKYRFKCLECNEYIYNEGLIARPICTVSSGHLVDQDSLTCVINDDNLTPENNVKKDYRKQRRDLIEYVIANSETMPMEELKIAAEHFCLPKESRDMFYTMNEQIKFGENFNRRATQSRNIRFNIVLSKFFNRYTYEQTTDIINHLTSEDLIFNYINLGVEGTTEGDPIGIFDYIESTSGTSYENAGLAQEPFDPIGVTKQQFIQKVMHILRDGCLDITCSGNCGF